MADPTTQTIGLANIVDVDCYPIDVAGDERLIAIIAYARRQLDSTGCLHLPRFIRPALLERLRAETDGVADEAYTVTRDITPYGDDGTGHDELPRDHPRRWAGSWSNGFVGKDRIPTTRSFVRCTTPRSSANSSLHVSISTPSTSSTTRSVGSSST